jgi:UDPglucose 6-dehydrogenase
MHVTMIGSGYVGLVSGACFAEFGHTVTCVDVDAAKVSALQKGQIPIYEPGLDVLVQKGISSKRLSFTTNLHTSVQDAQVVMIAVGTPTRRGDGHADLTYVYEAAQQIAKAIKNYTVVVTKSTVPVGTCRKVAEIIETERPDLKRGVDFDIASNPEFLREGSAIGDFMRPDRVVIGVDGSHSQDVMTALYRPLFLIETPIVFTGIETSELIKYASNAFLATKITFINQMADLCEKVGADVQDLAKGMGLDGRIGRKFLNAGPGYGGSCFPKDTLALSKTAQDYHSPISLVDSVIHYNEQRKEDMADRILTVLSKQSGAKTVALLGVTFKPNTDDLRDAPSLVIVPKLLKAGVSVRVYDPLYHKGAERLHHAEEFFKGVIWCHSPYEAAEGANALVFLTEWNEFRALDLKKVSASLTTTEGKPTIVDLRNIYKPHEMEGFQYISLGRGASAP